MELVAAVSPFAIAHTDPMECTLIQQGADLSPSQQQDLTKLVDQYVGVFSFSPGLTLLAHHEIKNPLGVVVKQWPYWVPKAHHQAIEAEVGITEEFVSP